MQRQRARRQARRLESADGATRRPCPPLSPGTAGPLFPPAAPAACFASGGAATVDDERKNGNAFPFVASSSSFSALEPLLLSRIIRPPSSSWHQTVESLTLQGQRGEQWGASWSRTRANRSTKKFEALVAAAPAAAAVFLPPNCKSSSSSLSFWPLRRQTTPSSTHRRCRRPTGRWPPSLVSREKG